MGVEGLQAVLVADDDDVAVAADVLGHPDLAGEGGIDGGAFREAEVDAAVVAGAAVAVAGGDVDPGDVAGVAVLAGVIDEPDVGLLREALPGAPVGVGAVVVPEGVESVLLQDLGGVFPVFVGPVAQQDDLDDRILGRDRVDADGGDGRDQGFDGVQGGARDEKLGAAAGQPQGGGIGLSPDLDAGGEDEEGEYGFSHKKSVYWYLDNVGGRK